MEIVALAHGEEDAPVARLEPVAGVRQRAADDHRHRIVDVGPLHLLFDVDALDAVRRVLRRRRRKVLARGRAAGVVVLLVAHGILFRLAPSGPSIVKCPDSARSGRFPR